MTMLLKGSGQAVPDSEGGSPSAELSIIGPASFQPTISSGVVRITLNAVRGVDTVFTPSADGDVIFDPNPVTIATGDLTADFSVSAGGPPGANPLTVGASAAGVTVTNTVQFEIIP